jgi:hypothetical protein
VTIGSDDLECYPQLRWSDPRLAASFASGEISGALAGEIAVRPWGDRSFYMEDPFGNKVCFVDRPTMFTGKGP